jgi:hypothetical protein
MNKNNNQSYDNNKHYNLYMLHINYNIYNTIFVSFGCTENESVWKVFDLRFDRSYYLFVLLSKP